MNTRQSASSCGTDYYVKYVLVLKFNIQTLISSFPRKETPSSAQHGSGEVIIITCSPAGSV